MYSEEQVAYFMRDGGGCDETVCRGYGMGEGGSVEAQHRAALDLWEKALGLDGADALNESQRAIALREVARHTAAIQPIAENPFSAPPYRASVV